VSSWRDIDLLKKKIQLSRGHERSSGEPSRRDGLAVRPRKRARFPGPFHASAASSLLLVLLAAHILLAGGLLMALVLLARLAALLALLLAGLLTGFGLVLPLLLLTGLTRRLARRLARLAALVIRPSQSPPGWFSQPEG
jgi:hypothetical protein